MAKDQNMTPVRNKQTKSRKLLWVVVVAVLLGIAAGIWIGVQAANQGTLSLSTSAKGLTKQDGSIKVRIRAVDALQLDHKLYTLDQTAFVKDGQLKLRWQPPDSAKKRATYIEICALDSNTSSNTSSSTSVKKACLDNKTETAYNKVSCPYYIAPNSTGFSGQLAGWNKLNDSQKVGCAGNKPTFGQTSGIAALAGVQSQGLPLDSNGILVSENGKITAKDINQLIADAITQLSTSQPSTFTFLTINSAIGATGTSGTIGTNGIAGATGATGPQGPSGIATCPNGNCLSLQAVTPGVQETGNVNVSGTVIANTFSGDGSALTSLNATNITSGTLSDAQLSGNVAFLDGTGPQTFTGDNKFTGTFLDQNAVDSSSAFSVLDALGNQGLNVDTTNKQIQLSSGWSGDLLPFAGSAGASGNEPVSVVANGYIYVIGGGSATVQYAPLHGDGTTGSWTSTTSLPASLSQSGGFAYNGYIYVIGGNSSTATYYSRINSNGTLGTWYSTTATSGSNNFSAVVYNGYVYRAASGGVAVAYAKLNPNGSIGSWTNTSMSSGSRPGLVVANGKLYDFNGSYTNIVQYADISPSGGLSNITAGPSLPNNVAGGDVPEYKTRAVVMNGYLYAFSDDCCFNTQLDYAAIPADGVITGWTTSTNGSYPYGIDYQTAPVAYNGYVYGNGYGQYTVNRTQIAGALDLVGLSGQNSADAGASGAGASLTAGNTSVVGSLNVIGQTSLAQGLGVSGDLNVGGQAVFQNTTNSTTAFQVQTANGNSLISFDTATTPNLITNPSFEVNTDGWAQRTGATLSKITTQQYVGNSSMQVVTAAAANNGVKYAYAMTNGVTYTFSFYAKAGAAFTTMQVGKSNAGTTAGEVNCLTGQTVSTTVWTRYSCTFTASSPAGTSYIYIKQSDASAHTYYIDGAQLEIAAAATNFTLGGVAIDGIVNSHLTLKNTTDSATSFQIQNAAGTTILGVDTVNGVLFSTIADGASAVGFTFNTSSYTTTGAKLISFQNNSVEKFSISKDGDIVAYGHLKSTQTTAPTIGIPSNCGVSPTATVAAGSTDSAGSITINAGTGGPTNCAAVISFNRAYGTAPKSIILTSASATGEAKDIYVSATGTTTFTVTMNTAPAASESNVYYYWVVE